jgi:hypothetical protein
MSAVLKILPLSVIYVGLIITLLNFVLMDLKVNFPKVVMNTTVIFVFFTLYGYIVSIYASKKQCDKIKHGNSLLLGLKTSLYAVIPYLIMFFVRALRQPFYELIGENVWGNFAAEFFYIGMNIIIATISIYYDSTKHNCRISTNEIEKNVKELDKYLDEPYPEKEDDTVAITD